MGEGGGEEDEAEDEEEDEDEEEMGKYESSKDLGSCAIYYEPGYERAGREEGLSELGLPTLVRREGREGRGGAWGSGVGGGEADKDEHIL